MSVSTTAPGARAAYDGGPLPASSAEGARGRDVGSWILAVAAFGVVALRQTDILPFVPLGLSPARFVLVVGACLWVLTRLFGQRSPYRLGALGAMLALYALALLSAYATQMTRPTNAPSLDALLVVDLLMILVVPFVVTVIHDVAGLVRVIKGLVAGGVVSALLALQQNVAGSGTAVHVRLPGLVDGAGIPFTIDDVFRGGMVRAQGGASHPLELACVLTMLFPLALALALSMRAAGRRWWPWAVASAVIVAGIAVTLARSGVIGLLVGLAVLAAYWPIRRTLAALAALAATITLAVLLDVPFLGSYLTIFTADSSVEQRAAVTSALPFDITPFGMYARVTGTPSPGVDVPTLDDQYLKALSETGVFGVTAYVALIGTATVLAYRAFARARNRSRTGATDPRAQLFLGVAAALAAYAVVSIFLDTAGFLQIWTLMWLLIAMAAVTRRLSAS
ncbi:O-antigen ligase family protein [Mycolicibacterium grossiae]|nr:hypothetical protein [Mycolicibacterium grossiae]QEM43835.1 hypothetical protein FZ046_02695 [Mycolicibacterium grossiae]